MTVTSFCCCCWATHKLFLLPFYSYREEILFCPTKRSLTVSHRFFYSSPDQEDPQTVIVALSVFQSTRDWLWRSRTFFWQRQSPEKAKNRSGELVEEVVDKKLSMKWKKRNRQKKSTNLQLVSLTITSINRRNDRSNPTPTPVNYKRKSSGGINLI